MFAPHQAASMELLTREGSTLVEEHWSMAGSTTVEPPKVFFFCSTILVPQNNPFNFIIFRTRSIWAYLSQKSMATGEVWSYLNPYAATL